MGPFSSTWLTSSPTSQALRLSNVELQCEMRRRLGIAVCFEGPDPHGHGTMSDNVDGRLNACHSGLLAAWKQVMVEAGGRVPDRNEERMLRNTHVPVHPDDCRRLDLVVPGLHVSHGLPLFCDIIVISPIARTGQPRPGASNRGGSLLEQAQDDNDVTYDPVTCCLAAGVHSESV